jgi:hypothetical protein
MATSHTGRWDPESIGMVNMNVASTTSLEIDNKMSFRKETAQASTVRLVRYETNDVEASNEPVVANMETIALKALHVDDDPTLNPWTFRMFALGNLLCTFRYQDSHLLSQL